MKSFQAERQFSYKKLLYQCAIFLAAVAVIVYFLPKEGTFNYQFDINKPWKYGLLTASFDFPIYKDEALYFSAEIYRKHLLDNEKAKALYEKVVLEHPDSLYYTESRKQYRTLRGDSTI